MSEQEILDGNKLIAEFMGAKYNSKLDLVNLGANHKLVGINELQYHSSWDWIMPSWSKLSSYLLDNDIDKLNELTNKMIGCIAKNDILNAQKLVVEGIKFVQ